MSEHSDEQTAATGRDRLDATGEFFSVGAPLHAVRAGYVSRAADELLYDAIVAGRFAHVIAPDRSGKSSLIAASAARLERNGFKIATLDLEQIGVRDAGTDAGRWYYSVAYRLLRQLRIRVDLQSWWQDKSILSNRQRLLEFYSEIVLQNVSERVVIFVDEIQCIGDLEFADQLLASIRAAHNARATDPEFSRLTFVLLGECDPLSLMSEPELSPFNVTQPIPLNDFTREELDLFGDQLNLRAEDIPVALDRIFYWTSGQPYLSQKLARSVSREGLRGDIVSHIDRIVAQQFTGRAALHNEPQLSHIHRQVVNDEAQKEALLNLFGRIRKGVTVATDLGSPTQRRLIAIGLITIDEDGNLSLRNRIYEAVFTTRWANENLPTHWRAPVIAALALLVVIALPFWYTQLLPQGYVDVLTSDRTELSVAAETYMDFRSFPGHVEAADNLYRNFLRNRARATADPRQVGIIADMARALPDAGRMPDELVAAFWDRRARDAMREERRDDALLATLEALVLSTPLRRNRAASLVSDDYPELIASLPSEGLNNIVFNPGSMLLTETRQARVTQWSLGNQRLQRREDWTITALEVSPLVRRVIVDREDTLRRAGLTLNLSHARVGDLRIKVIAPSGRAVDVRPGVDSAAANQDVRIPAAQLKALLGEPLNGTWSLSVRDEELGVAGHLVGWNLTLNSQGVIEDFQRGLNIPDPVERETDNIWFGDDGRFAVARAMQSDSARIWDLAFAKPVRAVAVSEFEQLIGLSAGARLLVTATQDTVYVWETATGERIAGLSVGAASQTSSLTSDGLHLFVQRRGDTETRFELWSLADAEIEASLTVAGAPALVALDARGTRIAVADYDRAVRIWDFASGEQIAQIDLDAQPSDIQLAAGGAMLGVVFGLDGAGLWSLRNAARPLVSQRGGGLWQLAFSASGTLALIGTPGRGFQVFDTRDGRRLGPVLGSGNHAGGDSLLGFSADERAIVTGGPRAIARFWKGPRRPAIDEGPLDQPGHRIRPASGDALSAVTPDGSRIVIGDAVGDVHVLPMANGSVAVELDAQNVSFLGHSSPVRALAISPDGSRAVSAADDNSIRIWDIDTGQPAPFFIAVSGNPVSNVAFSPDGSVVAVLSSNRLNLLATGSGRTLARIDLGQRHPAMAFAGNDALYLGSDGGELQLVAHEPGSGWTLQPLWQGDAGVRWLEASPRSPYLILVDEQNVARQFSINEGRLGLTALQLPSPVEEVVFAPSASRVLFRTPRWVHRASTAPSGLIWLDAVLAPVPLNGGSMIFPGAGADESATLGNRVTLPVPGEAFVALHEIDFTATSGPGLFGNREDLLAEWRRKLGRSAAVER